jgi:hypothetical protein
MCHNQPAIESMARYGATTGRVVKIVQVSNAGSVLLPFLQAGAIGCSSSLLPLFHPPLKEFVRRDQAAA